MAQNSGSGDDSTTTYGMDCSVRVPDDILSKDTKQFFSSKLGFLLFHYDDNHVASYGNQLLLRNLDIR